MRRPITTRIDAALCTGCGLCVEACPTDALAMRDGRAVVTGTESIACGHCAALCPAGAVSVGGIAPVLPTLATVDLAADDAAASPAALFRLMAARRSCRRFRATPVPRPVLEDLVRAGTLAPSGTNSEEWTFTVLPDRAAVEALAWHVGAFFRKLNGLSESRLVRLLAPPLRAYYREHHDAVAEALRQYDEAGRDRLFHGATAIVLVGSRAAASCPAEDALLASQNMLLAAEAMGLGTCLIGFAVEALRHDRSIGRRLGLPADERIHAVIALGWPARRFLREAGRLPATVRWWPRPPAS